MAGVLTFGQWVGGPAVTGGEITQQDQIKYSATLTDSNGDAIDITGYTFDVDYQTIVVDTVSYDRYTSEPNFANSSVIGYFPAGEVDTSTYISVIDASSGTFTFTLPSGLYDGALIPNARTNVPVLVVKIEITDAGSPANTSVNRVAYIVRYSPDNNTTIASPTDEVSYVEL